MVCVSKSTANVQNTTEGCVDFSRYSDPNTPNSLSNSY